jgi:hypothetical protein
LLIFNAAFLISAARLISFTLTLLFLAAFSEAVFGFAEAFPFALPLFFADLAAPASLFAAALPAAALPAAGLLVRPGLTPAFRAADEGLAAGVPGFFPWDEGLSAEAPVPFSTDEALPVGTPATPAALLSAGLSCPALAAFC